MTRPTRASAAGRAYLDLQNRARRENRGTQELLTMYVVERWLARLSCSAYVGHCAAADCFVKSYISVSGGYGQFPEYPWSLQPEG